MNLTNLGVQELNAQEQITTDGGTFWWLELWGGLNFISINPEYWDTYTEMELV